jgi:SHS2 domain-containing protein
VAAGEILPGVKFIEHTADVAIEVTAPGLSELFHRAAAAMFALIRGTEPDEPNPDLSDSPERLSTAPEVIEVRDLSFPVTDLAAALVAWLRELLYLQQAENLVYQRAEFETLAEDGVLRVRVYMASASTQVREIKGVTYHQLDVSRRDGSWHARVVFDV